MARSRLLPQSSPCWGCGVPTGPRCSLGHPEVWSLCPQPRYPATCLMLAEGPPALKSRTRKGRPEAPGKSPAGSWWSGQAGERAGGAWLGSVSAVAGVWGPRRPGAPVLNSWGPGVRGWLAQGRRVPWGSGGVWGDLPAPAGFPPAAGALLPLSPSPFPEWTELSAGARQGG